MGGEGNDWGRGRGAVVKVWGGVMEVWGGGWEEQAGDGRVRLEGVGGGEGW